MFVRSDPLQNAEDDPTNVGRGHACLRNENCLIRLTARAPSKPAVVASRLEHPDLTGTGGYSGRPLPAACRTRAAGGTMGCAQQSRARQGRRWSHRVDTTGVRSRTGVEGVLSDTPCTAPLATIERGARCVGSQSGRPSCSTVPQRSAPAAQRPLDWAGVAPFLAHDPIRTARRVR